MASKKNSEEKDYDVMELIAGKSEDEALAILEKRKSAKLVEQRKAPTKTEKIYDYSDSRVIPTSPNAIYEVFSRASGNESLFKGNNLQKFFGSDKTVKENFVNKKLPEMFDCGASNNYRITFKYFNHLYK